MNSGRETVNEYRARINNCCGYTLPFMYTCINDFLSSYAPSQIHLQQNSFFYLFFKYNLQEMYSLFKFDNIPGHWNKEYFIYGLLCRGWMGIVNAEPYGWIPQPCIWGGERNVFGFPLSVLVNNGWFNPTNGQNEYYFNSNSAKKEAFIVKTSPDYCPIADLAAFYAEKEALLFSAVDNSALLSKNGYMITADGKAKAQTISEALESILNGDIAVKFEGRRNMETGKIDGLDILETDIRKHYIVSDLMEDIQNMIDMFHQEIGFPVINRRKTERTLVAEQEAQNASVTIKSDLWFETLKESIDDFNRYTGYNVQVSKRYNDNFAGNLGKVGENDEPQRKDPVDKSDKL